MEMGAGDDRHTGQLTGEHSGDFCYLSAQPAESQKNRFLEIIWCHLIKNSHLQYCHTAILIKAFIEF